MNLTEELTQNYFSLLRLRGTFGYSRLSSLLQRKEMKSTLLGLMSNNGYDKEEVRALIDLYDETIFNLLDEKMSRGQRSMGWPSYLEKPIREELSKISSSHPQA